MMNDEIKNLLELKPYLIYGKYGEDYYLGLVQNCCDKMISIYVLDLIPDSRKKHFINLCELWWWESNRQEPINFFVGSEMNEFKPSLKHFIRKEFEIISGYTVSLQTSLEKRVRRKQISLIKKD